MSEIDDEAPPKRSAPKTRPPLLWIAVALSGLILAGSSATESWSLHNRVAALEAQSRALASTRSVTPLPQTSGSQIPWTAEAARLANLQSRVTALEQAGAIAAASMSSLERRVRKVDKLAGSSATQLAGRITTLERCASSIEMYLSTVANFGPNSAFPNFDCAA